MRGMHLLAVLVCLAFIAGCGSGSDEASVMPDVVGEGLDVAKSDLSAAGISEDDLEVVGGGMFGVVVESNWTVCEQSPSPGSTASDVRVIVDRTCEGDESRAGTDTSPPATTSSPTTVAPAPAPTTEPGPGPSVRRVAAAEARWLEILGVSEPIELLSQEGYDSSYAPLHAILPGWSGSTDSYVRIRVQQPLNDEEVRRLGINVLNLVGPEFREIQTLVFADSDGLDHNFFRSDAPAAVLN